MLYSEFMPIWESNGDASESEQQLEVAQIKKRLLDPRTIAESHRQAESTSRVEHANIPESELLWAYYKRMETMPLSNQEKREFLKPEVLAELNTEEYIALWRRLKPQFLSHVTRQGFRDHYEMFEHRRGLYEFHNGFARVLEDMKSLRPPFAVDPGLRSRDDVSVKTFLESSVLKAESEEEALQILDELLNSTSTVAPGYADKTAVHFGAQIVEHENYGGERDNEVFFVYPADVIASQYDYAFNGQTKNFVNPETESNWNDVFVWPSSVENPGIPLDSGIVFLPDHTPVDLETGSKYASEVKGADGEQKRTLVEDERLVGSFVSWVMRLNQESPIVKMYQEYVDNPDSVKEKVLKETLRQEMIG